MAQNMAIKKATSAQQFRLSPIPLRLVTTSRAGSMQTAQTLPVRALLLVKKLFICMQSGKAETIGSPSTAKQQLITFPVLTVIRSAAMLS